MGSMQTVSPSLQCTFSFTVQTFIFATPFVSINPYKHNNAHKLTSCCWKVDLQLLKSGCIQYMFLFFLGWKWKPNWNILSQPNRSLTTLGSVNVNNENILKHIILPLDKWWNGQWEVRYMRFLCWNNQKRKWSNIVLQIFDSGSWMFFFYILFFNEGARLFAISALFISNDKSRMTLCIRHLRMKWFEYRLPLRGEA